MDVFTLLLILAGTLLILVLFCYKCSTEMRLLFVILTAGIFVYSGLGISNKTVSNIYILHYLVFLTILMLTIKLLCTNKTHFVIEKKVKWGNRSYLNSSKRLDHSLKRMNKAILIFTVLFFSSLIINIIYPINRLSSLFNIANFTSRGIHARRLEHNSYLLLKLADTLENAAMPFFLVYLYNCASGRKRKQIKGILLILAWILLNFGKYNYLSRYELIIYLGFVFMYFIVCRYKSIVIDKMTIVLLIAAFIIIIPMLVSFTDIRLGRSTSNLGFWESLQILIETECYYPQNYDICVKNAGLIDPIQYILWVIFLPIPSALWSGKPVVQIAYSFTSLFYSTPVTASNYSNLLPSVLGESFLIFGPCFFWLEAIILGIVIGIFFRFFFKSNRLSLLTAYMLLLLATIGRGGSQSYLGVMINGSIVLIIWNYISRHVRYKR